MYNKHLLSYKIDTNEDIRVDRDVALACFKELQKFIIQHVKRNIKFNTPYDNSSLNYEFYPFLSLMSECWHQLETVRVFDFPEVEPLEYTPKTPYDEELDLQGYWLSQVEADRKFFDADLFWEDTLNTMYTRIEKKLVDVDTDTYNYVIQLIRDLETLASYKGFTKEGVGACGLVLPQCINFSLYKQGLLNG